MGWNHSLSPLYTKDHGQQTQWPNRIDGMESFTIPTVYKGSKTTDSVAKQNRWDGIIHYPHRIQRIMDNRLSGQTEQMGWNHSLSSLYTKDQEKQTQWPNRIDGMESFTIPIVYKGSWTTDSVAKQNRWDGIIHYPHCIQRIKDNRLSGQTEQMGWNHSLSPLYTKDHGQQTQWSNRIEGMESFTIPTVYKGSRTTDSVAKQNRWDGIIHYPHCIQRIMDNRLSGQTE